MREVAVLGIGQTKFGKFPDIRGVELASEAVGEALKDAGIPEKEIQVAYAARQTSGTHCQRIMLNFGISNIEMYNVQNACAGGSTALHGLWKDIALGAYDVGIAVGVEDMNFPKGQEPPPAINLLEIDLDMANGLTMPVLFANVARRQMDVFGATLEDFAQVAVKSHQHASLNPYAQFQKQFTVQEVLESRMIVDPITLYQCCPNSDGAAAVILCSMDVARKYTTNPVKIASSALVSGGYMFKYEEMCATGMATKAPEKAYEMAGIGPEDLDVIELHDAFAPEEIIRYEDLGICKRGEGHLLVREGATTLGGRIPVNPSGGLISLGHPQSASGVRIIVDITRQLRGKAGKMQVPDAKVGLAHMLGGYVTNLDGGACGIQILTR